MRPTGGGDDRRLGYDPAGRQRMSRELNLLLPRPQKMIPMLVRRKKRPGEKNKIHRTALVFGVMKVGEEVQARKFWAAGIQDVGGKGQWPRRR